jgi:endonuclease/exonuclease/phosphatase family metal-dependent hydrolase
MLLTTYESFLQQLFDWIFPAGFLTIQYGIWFVVGSFIISVLSILLLKTPDEKWSEIARRILIIGGMLVLGLFSPVILGFYIAFLFSTNLLAIKIKSSLHRPKKFLIVFLNILGILGVIGASGVLIFFWRLVELYLIDAGFLLGIIFHLIKPIRKITLNLNSKILSASKIRIGIAFGIAFIVLCGLFAMTGFIRPYNPAPEEYTPTGTMDLKVVTYNLRQGTGREKNKYDYWQYRKDNMVAYIDTFDADFICVQEAFHFQITYLTHDLTNRSYGYTGIGRQDGTYGGEHSAILFDKERFHYITGGSFWLSETPYIPSHFNSGDDSSHRICSWARFEEITSNAQICVFSVHYGFGHIFRTEASKLITARIVEYSGGVPVILAGDFNLNKSSSGFEYLENYGAKPLQSSFHLVNVPSTYETDTYNGFNITYNNPDNMIDLIFISQAITVHTCIVSNTTYNGPDGLPHFPSDHNPVIMTCKV